MVLKTRPVKEPEELVLGSLVGKESYVGPHSKLMVVPLILMMT